MEDFKQIKLDNQKYLPPKDLWSKIEFDLDYQNNIKPLLEQLPERTAPSHIWGEIEKNIPSVRMRLFKKKWVVQTVAASVLLVIGFGLGRWFNNKPSNTPQLGYSQVKTITYLDEDQESINEVLDEYVKKCKYYPNENSCSLVNDFTDLVSAKAELENIIKRMGNSDNIMQQLRRIELEKTRIIRNMAQRI
ncbi:MAG: hypothetical protein NWS66_15155 [Saprospiraceae bacterium]|jgi:hypothetical protein|nr:hypothetical protein [Saprospiraceae bacterium]MDP4815813.1 hypothetical protein [Saprospiraceae bacterium]MDP4913387.1 hypothetical protein [Saprospiraceae bacterium]